MNINEIIRKSFTHDLTDREIDCLECWLSESQENRDHYLKIKRIETLREIVVPDESGEERVVLSEVRENLLRKTSKKSLQRVFLLKFAAIFAGVAILGSGAYFAIKMKQSSINENNILVEKIENTSTQFKAMLVNGDQMISLDRTISNINLGSVEVENRYDDNCVRLISATDFAEARVQKYSSIIVPRGCRYEVLLPDSSHVWLNSESELTFPDYFLDTLRVVKITGEAYFDVKPKPNCPFIVEFNNTRVKVLGTQFNINSYNRSESKVTLVEGKIAVMNSKKTLFLFPSQQTVVNCEDGEMICSDVNVADFIGWLSGKFCYSDLTFKEIIEDLSRRFDYDFKIKDQTLRNERLTIRLTSGKISLMDVIRVLNKAGENVFTVDLDIEDQVIIIDRVK